VQLLWFLLSCHQLSLGLKFDGVNLNIYGICWGQSFVEKGIQKWEAETGAKVFAKWTCSADELEAEATSDMGSGVNFYDLFICTNKMVPQWASQGWLMDLTEEVREKPELGWTEVLPLFREIVATYNQSVYTVPWDGDVFLTYFRRDLAARDGWPAPETWTWEEFINIAQMYDGQDLNGDGEADYGACIASTSDANSFYHWIVPFLTMAQALGQRQGVFLNLTKSGIAPIVENAAFRKAVEILRASHGSYPLGKNYAEARADFTQGRCAIYFTWPSGATQSIKTNDDGTKVYIHGRMGVTGLPGSRQVLDWHTGNLVDCSPERCPYAVHPLTGDYDGINRVAWYANGGMGTVVNAGSSPRRQEAVVDFAMWYAKNLDVTVPSPYNPFREDHFNRSKYIESGWDAKDAQQFIDAEEQVLSMKNLVLDFRVPGINQFFKAYGSNYKELLKGNHSDVEEAIVYISQNVSAFIEGFGDIVKNPVLPGPLELERIYRQGIGLPMRSLTEMCQPGTGYIETNAKMGAGACVNCSAGMWGPGGTNQVCLECAPGTYEENTGSSGCSRCEAGTYSALGQSDCTACPEGTAPGLAGQDTCPCEQGRYGFGSECIECSGVLTTEVIGARDKSACVCPAGWYRPLDHNSSECLQCGDGLDCAINSLEANIPTSAKFTPKVGSYPKVMPSFFSFYDNPLATYACLSDKACPGGTPEKCGPHRVGLACGACDSMYYMADGECHVCGNFEKSRFLFPILPVLIGPILVVILYRSGQKDVETWQEPKEGIRMVLILCLAFSQTLAVMQSVDASVNAWQVSQGKAMQNSWTWTKWTLDFFSIARTECADFNTFTSAFIGKILLPVYVAAIFIATWLASLLTKLQMDPNILMSSYGGIFNAVYISIAAQALSLFQCYDHPDGRGASLRVAADILCYESEWNSLLFAVVPSVLVFCVFSIALYSFVIWTALDHITDKTFRMRWKFLLVKFRPSILKWNLVLLIKGLWLNLASVVFRTPERQLIWLSFGMLMYFAGALFYKPWRMYSVAMFDVLLHGLLVVIFGLYPFLVDHSSSTPSDVGFLVILISYGGYAATLLWDGYLIHQACTLRPKKDWMQHASELCKLFEQIGGRPEWLAEIFERLPWLEAQNMIKMAEVLESQMNGGRRGSQVRTTRSRRGKATGEKKQSGNNNISSLMPRESIQEDSQCSFVMGSTRHASEVSETPVDAGDRPVLLTKSEDQKAMRRPAPPNKIEDESVSIGTTCV